MSKERKTILIAYIPSRKDLSIAARQHWYRIPISTKRVPMSVKDKSLEIIAFYQPKAFGEQAFAVRFYGYVTKIKNVRRKALFRKEPKNPKSEDYYYKISIDKLLRLPKPIYSRKKRRILFISTTLEKFNKAEEINDLFDESPLEEKMWNEFKRIGIQAERQYDQNIGQKRFYLDFALFCKNRMLAIECDGDTYHTGKEPVQKDKQRDNLLQASGWNVLRFTTQDINYNFESSVNVIKDSINTYGGLDEESGERYFPKDCGQDNLFSGSSL